MNEIAPFNAPALMPVRDVERIAAAFAQSRMFGVTDANAALSLCLLAQAEGQHPAIAFRDYSIIQGKPSKKAEAMQRDFLQSGGRIEWLQLDDDCVKAKFTHPAGGSATIDWTMERAKAAGLGGKDMWKKWPRQMLRSRVISEGVRTVCPMATSGMYVPEEVRDFDDVKEPAQPSTDGGIIEGEFTTGERERTPPPPGITKIKNNLNKFMREGNKAADLEAFRKLVHDNRADLKTIRDANHSYWTGDGEDHEGYEKWMERRYAELTPPEETLEYQMLISCVNECRTAAELMAFLDRHGDAIDTLDGEESRSFEALFDAKAEALKNPTPIVAGTFGG